MKFIGVDLGWQSQPSGLCCLEWQKDQLHLLTLDRLADPDTVLHWIDTQISPSESGLIAVDAPTLISNATGMRLVDRMAHQYFGRYHAGCYPANLSRPFAQRTVGFGQSLLDRGFVHAPDLEPQQTGRFQIEVFPHPAIVHLFGLSRILKYKKGRLAERQAELARYQHYLITVLPTLQPSLPIGAPLFEIPVGGATLKAVEDQLDSLICAYVAAHWWYWGRARNWVVGPTDPAICAVEGYIVVPAPLQS